MIDALRREACPLCGGKDVQFQRAFQALPGLRVDLQRCRRCRSEYLDPLPPQGVLAREYENYFARRTELCTQEHPKAAMFARLLRRLLSDFPAPPSQGGGEGRATILELGAGSGDFMKAAQQVAPAARRIAVDMNPADAERFRPLGCEFIASTVEDFLTPRTLARAGLPPGSVDYLFLFDVLEHLTQPREVLRQLAGLLRPSGLLVLTLPNAEAFSRRQLGRLWFQFKLEHLQYPSTHWQPIAAAAGLEVVRRETHYKLLPLEYLLSVGRNFGPPVLQRLTRWATWPTRLLPRVVRRLPVRLPLGESLVVLRRAACAAGAASPARRAA